MYPKTNKIQVGYAPQILTHEMFEPLRNPAFFKAVEVEQGGYGLVWSDSIDISEYELWKNGLKYSP